MTDAHDPMVAGAGNSRAPLHAMLASEEDRHFLYTLCKFNNMYGLDTRELSVAKRKLSWKALFDAVQECQVCLWFRAWDVPRTGLNEFVCPGL